MPYIPHSEDDVREMLEVIGAESLEDLWQAVPEKIRLGRPLDLRPGLPESELIKEVHSLARKNREAGRLACFLGGGTYFHYTPPAVDHLISRGEFFTAYTPYQPEISQGTLQAIFEFQTMVCELTGMDVANASMYDGSEATAEAVLMAERMRPKNKEGQIVLAGTLNPQYKWTVSTYTSHSGRDLVEAPFNESGTLDLDDLRNKAEGALAVVVQNPNYFGCLEELDKIKQITEETGAVFIVAVAEALSMALITPPGDFGADVVVAEGQSLGIPMGFGGPHLGLFACRKDDMRRIPGRLVGETVDTDGRRGFVLTLATREQHIRRARATSNICTNQGLLALASSIYMTLLGPEGLRELAAINRARCEYLKGRIEEIGAKLVFDSPTFNEFVIDLGKAPDPIIKTMLENGMLAGIPLAKDHPGMGNAVLVTVTEMVSREELDQYVLALKNALSGG